MELIGRSAIIGISGVLLLLTVLLPSVAAGAQIWQTPYNISVVWPHDSQGNQTKVSQSQSVNVSIWPSSQVNCTTDAVAAGAAGIRIFVSKNNDPAEVFIPSSPSRLILRSDSGSTFPSLEINDVPADLISDPTAQYRFTTWAGNIWVHAADARTYQPKPVVPTGYATAQAGDLLDLRIQVVWPHDRQGNFASVDEASLVNVAVDLFAHGTLNSVRPDFQPYGGFAPTLSVAVGNNPIEGVESTAQKTTYTAGGQAYPRWVFNDVSVQPGRQYNFFASVSTDMKKLSQFSTIWTHGSDARTYLPNPQPPPQCLA